MIPLLGYLDDLLLLPIGIYIALRMIPAAVKAEARLRATESSQTAPMSRAGNSVILLIWLLGLLMLLARLWPHFLASANRISHSAPHLVIPAYLFCAGIVWNYVQIYSVL